MALNSQLNKYYQQEEPRLGNQYLEDSVLRAYLKRLTPPSILAAFEPELVKFGERVAPGGDILEHGRASERNPPRLTNYNAFGRRIDKIEVHPGWNHLQDISAEEGLIAIGYERTYKEWSRLFQMSKHHLFATSSAIFDCPLAMTDGGARLAELNFSTTKQPESLQRLKDVYAHFLSREPAKFWTGGQWMTERTGGSDVGPSETIAKRNADGSYSITGFKFFTSATTSPVTFMLARIVDDNGQSTVGSRGLSVFSVDTHRPDGTLNNIIIHKLKNKMGTKAVPTAELELCGASGYLIGEPNSGVKVISAILNITRIHNAVNSVACIRRSIAVARDYASRRKVFGALLSETPLHLQTLADLECEYRGALAMTLEVVVLLGKTECGTATETDNVLLRLLTPLLKLYTGKQSVAVASEAIESLGGTGYMEDSDMPRLLRDTQVTSIWEGTTNVLSMDVWRPIQKENALPIFIKVVKSKLATVGRSGNQDLAVAVDAVQKALDTVVVYAKAVSGNKLVLEATARQFALTLSRIYIATLVIEHAVWAIANPNVNTVDPVTDIATVKYWCSRNPLVVLETTEPKNIDLRAIEALAMDKDPKTGKHRGVGEKGLDGKLRARY